jgi:hypothetical protein
MSISNSYTLKKYKEHYTILLEKHKLEYEDFDEYTFIDKEIKIFQKGLLLDLDDIEFEHDLDFDENTLDPILNFDANGNLSQPTYEKIEGATRRTIEYIGDAQKHNLSSSLIINFLEQRKQELEKESIITLEIENNVMSQCSKPITIENIKNAHPKHDPNYWNAACYDLFKYIFDEYYKNTNRQLTNIWFFLKHNAGSTYVLKATKEEYTAFILRNYNKEISNFEKAPAKWIEKELPTLQDHRLNFEENLKEITKHLKNT